jgi:hypothetical protein
MTIEIAETDLIEVEALYVESVDGCCDCDCDCGPDCPPDCC